MDRRSTWRRIVGVGVMTVLALSAAVPAAVAEEPRPTDMVASTGRGLVSVRRDDPAERVALPNPPNEPSPVVRPERPDFAAGDAPRSPALAAAGAPVEAALTADPPIGRPGTTLLGRGHFNSDPPDSYLAVGPRHLFQVVSGGIGVWERDMSNAVTWGLPSFIATVNDGLDPPAATAWYDPRVIYDEARGRFILTAVGFDCHPSAAYGSDFGTGFTFIAVVRPQIGAIEDWLPTADAGYLYWPDTMPDSTSPGTTRDKLVLASNVFALTDAACSTSYVGGDLTFIPWADWDAGNPTFGYDELPPAYFGPRAAIQTPAVSTRTHVVAQYDDGSGGLDVRYLTYTSFVPWTSGQMAPQRDVNLTADGVVGEFVEPPGPTQPGPDTVTTSLDSRPRDAVWQNDRLVFVSDAGCTPTGDMVGRSCVRVTELDTTGVGATVSPTLHQDFLIAAAGKDSYVGGVGLSGTGILNVVWNRSSSTAGDYISSHTAYQLPTDPVNAISPPELLAEGTGTITSNEWGRYIGVAPDPSVPSAVWQAAPYANAFDGWDTYASQLRPEGTTYVPVDPVRVLDTRTGTGLSGRFIAGTPRTWPVSGAFGIPAEAVAVTGNVTVTGQEASGYVSVTPLPTSTPTSSTLNFPVGDTRANNLIVSLAPDGRVAAVYKAGSGKRTHVIMDVTGYFVPDDSGATFDPLGPVRVLDSRTGKGLTGVFASSVPRELPIAGLDGVPGTATAITGNLTVTQQSSAGYLAITTEMTATPTTSSLNFPTGDNRANGVVAPLDPDGDVWIVFKGAPGSTAHVLLDVTGYFEPGTDGLRFVPLSPGRVADTRTFPPTGSMYQDFQGGCCEPVSGVLASGKPRGLYVGGMRCDFCPPLHEGVGALGIPGSAEAITGNLTVTGQTGSGYVSATATMTATPTTSTINFPVGDTRANGIVAPLFSCSGGCAYDATMAFVYKSGTTRTTHVILDVSGYFE